MAERLVVRFRFPILAKADLRLIETKVSSSLRMKVLKTRDQLSGQELFYCRRQSPVISILPVRQLAIPSIVVDFPVRAELSEAPAQSQIF